MEVYILFINKKVHGVFSSIKLANLHITHRFGDHRTYFETVETNGVKLIHQIECHIKGEGWYYLDLIPVRVDHVIRDVL